MKNNIIIIAAAGLTIIGCQKKENTDPVVEKTTVVETATAASTKRCYLQVTEAKGENGKIVNDSLLLNIETNGDSITGTFKWLPYYKDKKTGDFKGTYKGNAAKTILSAKAEGMTNLEELDFTFDDKQASVKFGEMAEGPDGIWHYKDAKAASMETVPMAECK
jgi:hypothetical protein